MCCSFRSQAANVNCDPASHAQAMANQGWLIVTHQIASAAQNRAAPSYTRNRRRLLPPLEVTRPLRSLLLRPLDLLRMEHRTGRRWDVLGKLVVPRVVTSDRRMRTLVHDVPVATLRRIRYWSHREAPSRTPAAMPSNRNTAAMNLANSSLIWRTGVVTPSPSAAAQRLGCDRSWSS